MEITKEQLLSFTPQFLNDFEDVDGVLREFTENKYGGITTDAFNPDEIVILYADYTYENYSGDAYVFGYNKVKECFFEVHGGHCSCYGLERQWVEDELTIQETIDIKSKWLDAPFDEERYYYSRSACKSEDLYKWWKYNLNSL